MLSAKTAKKLTDLHLQITDAFLGGSKKCRYLPLGAPTFSKILHILSLPNSQKFQLD
jgi:hypothetical protein